MIKSEFGRGFAMCLMQFLFHNTRLDDDLVLYADMLARGVGQFEPSHAVEMWADGAVDHLLDLIRPRRHITRAQWAEAQRIRDRMLAAKWGRFDGVPMDAAEARATIAAARNLLDAVAAQAGLPAPATITDAEQLDLALGLTSVKGNAAYCTEPMPSRRA